MKYLATKQEAGNVNFDDALQKEWITTNGIGGYASSTLAELNNRKYHGLLVAALTPPTSRRVIVNRIEEIVKINDKRYNLSPIQYPNSLDASNFDVKESFKRNPTPKYTYNIDGHRLSKRLLLPDGKNAVLINYKNKGNSPITLALRPFLNFRDFHSLSHNQADCHYEQTSAAENKVTFFRPETNLYFQFSEGEYKQDELYFENIEYIHENDRGHEFQEVNFNPGLLTVTLAPEATVTLSFSLKEDIDITQFSAYKKAEIQRLQELQVVDTTDIFLKDLIRSGDQFIVQRDSTKTHSVIAGYHWFSDWGRDTMIALRGLAIPLKKQQLSKDIIKTFMHYLSEGMIPNRFPDDNEPPVYNTVDATLLSFATLYDYDKTFNDEAFIKQLMPQLKDIILHHKEGTRWNTHETKEGFIFSGDSETQLTWMDAIFNKHSFTPRWSCAVEITALWYNALKTYNHFLQKYNLGEAAFTDSITNIETNFKKYFYNHNNYLNDLVNPGEWDDTSIRPNQLYAISLPFPLLNKEEAKGVIKVVKEELLTPFGLRTLDTKHPDYQGYYGGGQFERDAAYHQGTSWPFLLGEYFAGYIYTYGNNETTKQYIHEQLTELKHHFYHDSCIFGLSEIFDGDDAVHGKGCIQQAWSVSQLIRILLQLED